VRVLVTGAAGRIGRAVRPLLASRFALRAFDRLPVDDALPGEEVVQGDLTSRQDLDAAMVGVEGVVHLAAVHGHGLTFEGSWGPNYLGTLKLLEAAERAGVTRFVYASSHHVFGMHRREGFQAATADLAPDAYYGLSKAFGELACAMFAHRAAMRTLIVRIGNADPAPSDDRSAALWVSAADLTQLFTIGLTHPDVVCDVVYGVSACERPVFPDHAAGRFGYRPADRAADHVGPGFVPYEAMPARLGRDFVGGAYALVPLPPTEETP
jgi:uronate dehydrogenase